MYICYGNVALLSPFFHVGHLDVLSCLVNDLEADPEAMDKEGFNSMHAATQARQTQCVKVCNSLVASITLALKCCVCLCTSVVGGKTWTEIHSEQDKQRWCYTFTYGSRYVHIKSPLSLSLSLSLHLFHTH